MARKVSRRFVGFACTAFVWLVPAISQVAPAQAAGTGTMFAITGINQSVLSRLDPATGVVSPIEDLAGPNQGQLGTLTGDPATHRLFTVRTSVTFVPPSSINITNEVLTINSQDGTVITTKQVNAPVNQVVFDSASSTLFLLGFNGISKLDPATGATTPVASLSGFCCGVDSMAVVPGGQTVYVNNDNPGFGNPPSDQILTVDTATGAITPSATVPGSVRIISYDTASGGVFGLTDCCPRQLVKLDPSTAAATPIGTIDTPADAMTFAMAVDPASHTVFADLQSYPSFNTIQDRIVSINDVSGSFTLSSSLATDTVWSMYFEVPVVITPDSIKADVQSALATGAISNAGVASSLLAELSQAQAARSRGQCGTAGNLYRAFINDVNAQSGKAIAAATAGRLVSEAQFLIANCP